MMMTPRHASATPTRPVCVNHHCPTTHMMFQCVKFSRDYCCCAAGWTQGSFTTMPRCKNVTTTTALLLHVRSCLPSCHTMQISPWVRLNPAPCSRSTANGRARSVCCCCCCCLCSLSHRMHAYSIHIIISRLPRSTVPKQSQARLHGIQQQQLGSLIAP